MMDRNSEFVPIRDSYSWLKMLLSGTRKTSGHVNNELHGLSWGPRKSKARAMKKLGSFSIKKIN